MQRDAPADIVGKHCAGNRTRSKRVVPENAWGSPLDEHPCRARPHLSMSPGVLREKDVQRCHTAVERSPVVSALMSVDGKLRVQWQTQSPSDRTIRFLYAAAFLKPDVGAGGFSSMPCTMDQSRTVNIAIRCASTICRACDRLTDSMNALVDRPSSAAASSISLLLSASMRSSRRSCLVARSAEPYTARGSRASLPPGSVPVLSDAFFLLRDRAM
jgi:hypothetical protein